jgi:hypothetical protein
MLAQRPCPKAWSLSYISGTTIPKILHQTWPGTYRSPPAHMAAPHQTWLDHLDSEWTLLWYSNDDVQRILKAEPPHRLRATLEEYLYPIQKYDAFRYIALNKWGGVYADGDVVAMDVPRFPHTEQCNVFFSETTLDSQAGQLSNYYSKHTAGPLVHPCENSFMASPANHPVWQGVFDAMIASAPHTDPFYMRWAGAQDISKTAGIEVLSAGVQFYYAKYATKTHGKGYTVRSRVEDGTVSATGVNEDVCILPQQQQWMGVPRFYDHLLVQSGTWQRATRNQIVIGIMNLVVALVLFLAFVAFVVFVSKSRWARRRFI